MPITIAGSGTIGGISAGGLPDASIVTADIADANITAAKLNGAQSGSAPIYAARAWVNFNGTGTVAIRASGNVSSITDNGTGDYTVNFTTAMADVNYAVTGGTGNTNVDPYKQMGFRRMTSTSQVRLFTSFPGNYPASDAQLVCVSVFR